MPARINHQPGERRGRLTYISDAPGSNGKRKGNFRCDCGTRLVVWLDDWRCEHTVSCGCFKVELDHARFFRHGATRRDEIDPLYVAWKSMRTRCSEKFQAKSPTYGGVVCDPRWETFEGFRDLQPLGIPFEPGLVLARFGDTGNYSPENTRWATKGDNSRESIERRMRKMPDGRYGFDVAQENGITKDRYNSRIRRGWTVEQAATTPVGVPRLA